jgi:putative heme-binding domain-containing protein
LHLSGQSAELDLIWPHLGSDDPFLRHAARVALEQRPMPLWRERALAENNPWAVISALMALARLGSADTQTPLLERLAALGWEELTAEQRAAVLRIWSLALARHERLPAERLAPIAQLLDRRYPDEAPPVNQLLCELLVYLGSPNAIGKTLALLEMAKTQEEKLEYLFLLREAAGPSTPEQNRSYFDALRQARHFYGGSELPRMLGLIKADAVARLTEAEQTALAPLLADEPPSEVPVELVNRPFVRDWKFDDLVGSIEQIGNGRDLAAGKAIFAAALCSKCHRMAGQGTAIGPDLTSLARRFGPVDILLSILAPSRVVDEKYRLVTIETTDGRVLKGQLLGDDGQFVTLLPDVLAADKTLRLAKSEIESLTHSIVSPMPDGLLNRFTKDEVLDLLAYLESEGVESAAKPVLPK